MDIRQALGRFFFGDKAASRLRSRGANRILELEDRRLMAEAYIPALAREGGRILAIGCRAYNLDDYAPLQAEGAELWTSDIDPKAKRWGVPDRHRTADACHIDEMFADLTFDAILCNGVLGHGVDNLQQQRQTLAAMAAILRPGGRLLLGWNTDRIVDPIEIGLTDGWFRPVGFAGQPARVVFDDLTHVYDSLIRNDS